MPDTKNLVQRQSDAHARIEKALSLEPNSLLGEARGDPQLARTITMENIASAVEKGMKAKSKLVTGVGDSAKEAKG